MSSQRDIDSVRHYYSKVLASSADLKTHACCCAEAPPPHLASILSRIDPAIVSRFYGCGSPIPDAIEGCTILDLGCGTGRDAFVCAALAGDTGRVIGLDMTEEQLDIGRTRADQQCRRLGLTRTTVDFRQGYLEDLPGAGIEPRSVDVAISNCVINLSPDKPRVFEGVFRALKEGGEVLFSDVFADRRLDPVLRDDPELLGECLAGAMYIEDFRRLLLDLGIRDYRVVSRSPLQIGDPKIEERIGMAHFSSVTVRAFNLPDLEDRCEDYGQVAWYLGTLPHHPHRYRLDDHHLFETGRPLPVCSNTAAMLSQTRLAPHFRIEGNTGTHFGLFDCAPPTEGEGAATPGGCC
ncbi:MAG: methyltransferase domain-containing protein [Acidobacteriota bacterium]|nr:methyltransferase domain-containing protein [Acidobacteriota bacterium]MDQ7088670.1 methyltransferase domain-containing protein [Acidobacteriota bacterium]